MSKYDKILQKLNEESITIQYPRIITENDLKLPEWYKLKEEYKTAKSNPAKITISIKNAILNQRRVYFCLTRKVLRKLIEEDNNWIKKPKFDNNSYKGLISLLTNEFNIFELCESGQGMRPDIFKLKDPDLLHYIIVDETKQLITTKEFVNKYNKKTDQGADLVISNKEIVISNYVSNQMTENIFLDILKKSDLNEIVNTLKSYKCNNPNKWKMFIESNCDEIKSKAIISNLGLLKD